jgi:hypothetical protein
MKVLTKILINLPISITLLFTAQLVESRMFYSDLVFKARHNGDITYGTGNDLDGRACAVIDGRAIFGKMSNDGKSAILAGKKISIIQAEPRNYAFSLKLAEEWWDNPQSKKCLNYTSYGQCFVNAGVPYYFNDPSEQYAVTDNGRKYKHNSRLRKVFKNKTKVFVEAGVDNNYAIRDGVKSLVRFVEYESRYSVRK